MPTTPSHWWVVDSSSIRVLASCAPPATRAAISTTIEECPSANQKPTETGRLPSAISFRVVLSITAMWSASKACRMPRVYAVMPRPTPKTWVPTSYFSGATRKISVPKATTCMARITPIRPAVRTVSSRRHRKVGRAAGAAGAATVSGRVILGSRSSTSWKHFVRCRGRSPG